MFNTFGVQAILKFTTYLIMLMQQRDNLGTCLIKFDTGYNIVSSLQQCKTLKYDTTEETDLHEASGNSKEDQDRIFSIQECKFEDNKDLKYSLSKHINTLLANINAKKALTTTLFDTIQ